MEKNILKVYKNTVNVSPNFELGFELDNIVSYDQRKKYAAVELECGEIKLGENSHIIHFNDLVKCKNIVLGKNAEIIHIGNLKNCENIILDENASIYHLHNLEECGDIFMDKKSEIQQLLNLKKHGNIIMANNAKISNCPLLKKEQKIATPFGYSYYLDNTKEYSPDQLKEIKSKIEKNIRNYSITTLSSKIAKNLQHNNEIIH